MFEYEKPIEEPKRSGKWITWVLLLLLGAGSASGVTWLALSSPPERAVTAAQPSGTNIVDVTVPGYVAGEEPIADAAEKILPSVVQIRTNTGVGSGVIFGDGLIMTAAHVVSGESTVSVRLEDGEVVEPPDREVFRRRQEKNIERLIRAGLL